MITIENVKEIEYNEEELITRATCNAHITREEFLETFNCSGLMGIYNLGMKHMLQYLIMDPTEPVIGESIVSCQNLLELNRLVTHHASENYVHNVAKLTRKYDDKNIS